MRKRQGSKRKNNYIMSSHLEISTTRKPKGGVLLLPRSRVSIYREHKMMSEEERQELGGLGMYFHDLLLDLVFDTGTRVDPEREFSLQWLLDEAQTLGPVPLLDRITALLTHHELKRIDLQLVVRILKTLQQTLSNSHTQAFLKAVQPLLLLTKKEEDREEGEGESPYVIAAREMVYALTTSAGLDAIVAVVAPQADDASEHVRDAAARTFGVVASALGIPEVLPTLQGFLTCTVAPRVRCTGLRMVEQIAITTGCAVGPHITTLVDIIEAGPTTIETKTHMLAALAALAEAAVPPYGLAAFEGWCLNFNLLQAMNYYSGEEYMLYLQLHCSIVSLLSPVENKRWYVYMVVNNFGEALMMAERRCVSTGLKGLKRALPLMKVLLRTDPLGRLQVEDHLQKLVWRMWGWRGAIDRRDYKLLLDASVALVDAVGMTFIRRSIQMYFFKRSPEYRRMVCQIIEKAVDRSCCSSDAADQFGEVLQDVEYLFLSDF